MMQIEPCPSPLDDELGERFAIAFRKTQESSNGCDQIECMYPIEGNCHCFNQTLLAFIRTNAPMHRVRPWCETCDKDVHEVLCPTCAKWWSDNPPPAWQGIESAPKDGTTVLGYGDGRQGLYAHDCGSWVDYGGHAVNPTHWQPLPEPPETK
jgi:hypothetical protein